MQVERFLTVTMKVKIHHEGENILLILFLIIVATGAMAYRFFDYKPVAWCLIALMGILFLLVLNCGIER